MSCIFATATDGTSRWRISPCSSRSGTGGGFCVGAPRTRFGMDGAMQSKNRQRFSYGTREYPGASAKTRQRLNIEQAARLALACETSKVCHRTLGDAERAAEFMMEQGAVEPMHHQVAYKCTHCAWWHVGSQRVHFKPEE